VDSRQVVAGAEELPMQARWLIDADMFAGYREELVAAIRAAGHEAHLIRAPQPPYRWDDVGSSYWAACPADACVIAHGDIEFVTRIRRESRWLPGAFGTVENYFCSNYYCHLGQYLLNRDYIMLPFGELRRQREFLFSTIGRDGKIFVRPDSPLKLFTGQVVARNTFERDLEFMAFYEFPPRSLVLASAPFRIEKEWRFVVAEKEIVAGCQYKHADQMSLAAGFDPQARDLAAVIAAQDYQPDPVWIVDICQTTDGQYHLLEIGGFSFADLYLCDKAAIAKAVSAAATAEWQRSASK
jgi:hypothetical protein